MLYALIYFSIQVIGLVYIQARFHLHQENQMDQMMLTMALSMVFGLSIGLLSGLIFYGNLYESTIYGATGAALLAIIFRFRMPYYTIMEGIFSGIMAGMMGAMLAEMLTISQGHRLLFVACMLTSVTSTLYISFSLTKSNRSSTQTNHSLLFILTCIWMLLALSTFPNNG